ncbi:hypothetical protein JCM11491_003737 [Sporobolomyces phaffii]
MSKPRAILALPNETVSRLRSAVVVPSFAAIASALVANALDARATAVHLALDLATYSLECRDNGHGIPPDQLEALGRYVTTTPDTDPGFPRRGEALESIQDFALVRVTSRAAGRADAATFESVRRTGETLAFDRTTVDRDEPGTTVSVRDVFYNYPVRRKALSTRAAQLAAVSDIRTHLAVTSLVHPGVAFHLTDTPSSSSVSREPKCLVSVSKTAHGALGRWKQLWGRAGVERVSEVDRTGPGGMRLAGFISHSASPARSNQFIFVNGRPVSSTTCEVHRSINDAFAASSFSRHASALLASPRGATSASPARSRRRDRTPTPKRTVDQHPIFLLALALDPATEVDTSYGPEDHVEFTDERAVVGFVRDAVEAFLVDHGYLSPPAARRSSHRSTHVAPGPGPGSEDPASSMTPLSSRCVRGLRTTVVQRCEDEDEDSAGRPRREGPGGGDPRGTMVDRSALKRKTRASLDDDGHGPVKRRGHDDDMPQWLTDTLARWDNPVFPAATARGAARSVRIPSLAPPPPPPPRRPLFAASKPFLSNSHKRDDPTTHARLADISTVFTPSSSSSSSAATLAPSTAVEPQSFSRASLRTAEFVAQVDDKYLAVVVAGATLVLFDQHAVSERVRVERFLAGVLRGPGPVASVAVADGGVAIVVSREDARDLEQHRAAFLRWGFAIDFGRHDDARDDARSSLASSSSDYVQVAVTTVPAIVAARLTNDAPLVQGVVRAYLAQLRDRPPPPPPRPRNDDAGSTTTTTTTTTSWVEHVKDCPTGLVELITSKACRGAVMFNDRLREDQARELVRAVAETTFPFVCAHGRPSIVPLVHLASSSSSSAAAAAASSSSSPPIDWARLEGSK